ncbi:640_t:CDS:2, partial [Paraglomus occultum]
YGEGEYKPDERIDTPIIYTQTITRTTTILPTESPTPIDNVDDINDDTTTPDDNSDPGLSKDELVNLKYCKSKQCKFIFAYKHGEQESKAQMHFRSIVGLALRLNRTIVLPNVGGSRLGACLAHPFDYYYDMDGLRKQFPQLKFILLADFKKWTREREIPPTIKYVEINRERITRQNWVLDGYTNGTKLRKAACLGDCNPLLIPEEVPTTTIGLHNRWANTPKVMEEGHLLIINNTQTSAEFLLVKAHSFRLLFPTEA